MENLATLFNNRATVSSAAANSLQTRYAELVQQQPKMRRRDIAAQLQVPEAALIDQQCAISSIRLQNNFADIIHMLPSLGYIMTLTRNNSAVHERKGIYANVSIKGPMGLVITEDRKIDLRIILSRWASAFAVQEPVSTGFRYSLQFFDQAGTAIQKIFLQRDSYAFSYRDLVTKFRWGQSAVLEFNQTIDQPQYLASETVNRQQLVSEWQQMSNVHQFLGLLKRHQISRLQAFGIVAEPLAQQFDPVLVAPFLTAIATAQLSIMCFVGNRGNIQIHTGEIHTVKRLGPWLNILDPEFNLHLLEDEIASAWLIRKPTVDGNITSIELYDASGETIVQFFGQRTEGNPENPEWRALAEGLLKDVEQLA